MGDRSLFIGEMHQEFLIAVPAADGAGCQMAHTIAHRTRFLYDRFQHPHQYVGILDDAMFIETGAARFKLRFD